MIADEIGADQKRLRNYIGGRIDRWRTLGMAPVKPEDGKTVVYRRQISAQGEIVLKPIRLPYVTMHARALEARR